MSTNPCQICGSTDLNLVDGYYYCVECGTQDVNVQETVVEHIINFEGPHLFASRRKITFLKDAIQMSGEWHKWHAFNFILVGLADELIAMGAKPTVKMKLLWAWTRYIKKFQKKEEAEATLFENVSANRESNSDKLSEEEDSIDSDDLDELLETSDIWKGKRKSRKRKKKIETFSYDIKRVTKGLLLSLLYIALNLDKSDIQLNHLMRFVKEGRLSINNAVKFVPKELSIKLIPGWINFLRCQRDTTPKAIRHCSMILFKRLKLGVPLVPDLNKIVDNYIQELCLPQDFKDLVLSLFNLMPCNFLQLQTRSLRGHIRVPDYETVCMSYVLLALKMCFGLDCDYEIKLSDEVDKINCDEGHFKSYKTGTYSLPTDRLFSFREWCRFLQFRKMILCKYYLPMSKQYNLPADDCVFIEHLGERYKRKIRLSDDITMNILSKIPLDEPVVIPKDEFVATLTPMTLYTKIVLDYIKDPELKQRMSEDFSQYSLTYTTRYLKLPGFDTNSASLMKGVDETNKVINPCITGSLFIREGDSTMVLVRNCENKNWLKTKRPTIEHVTKGETNISSSDKEKDYGYDSSFEFMSVENDDFETKVSEENFEEIFDLIEEEDEDVLIFDDDFINFMLFENEIKMPATHHEENEFQTQNSYNIYDSKFDIHDDEIFYSYDPHTFDRNETIHELIELACKKYKIPIPKKNESSEPRKRKFENNRARKSDSTKRKSDKKRRLCDGTSKELVNAYYNTIDNDVLHEISEHVKSVIQIAERDLGNDSYIMNEAPNQSETEFQDVHPNNDDNGQNPEVNDSSMQGVTLNGTVDDEDNGEELIPRGDPKFDAETHDIDQLYVKINEEAQIENVNIESDPEINEVIDKKILETVEHKKVVGKEKQKQISDPSDSDDDLPLSVLRDEKLSYMKRNDKAEFEYLIENYELKNFGYWMKHYSTCVFTKNIDLVQKFNIELMENSPISFVFVIHECAAILNCTAFCLYKTLQQLEKRLLSCIGKKIKTR